MVVLDLSGNILLSMAEALGKENKIIISKIYWLTDKENSKIYRSIMICIIKVSDA